MSRADVFVHENIAPLPGQFHALAIREDVLYSDARGRPKNTLRKQAEKILPKLEPILGKLLQPGESIFYVARMNTPISVAEQLTAGWFLHRSVVVVMVFTNERVICLPVTYAGAPKGSARVIAYPALAAAKVGGVLSKVLELRYGTGKKDRFWRLKRRDAKKIAVLLRVFTAQNTGATVSAGLVSLCPECLQALTPQVYQCAGCGLVFKDERTMRKRALLIPGGGYFYSGATGMGVLAVIAEVYLVAELLFLTLAFFGAFALPAEKRSEALIGVGIVMIFFLAALGFEKLVQINHCKRFIRDFISTGEKKPILVATGAAAGATASGMR
ncbi:MAG: hypothetical protein M3P27_01035 [Acidobacteriota bacterium]|nr:hypothetical protein [Acidobacteriota bacterium]